MGFALQIGLKDGGSRHFLGHTSQQRAEFEAMAGGWRDQPESGYYVLAGGSGGESRLYVRDIADVRLVTS